MSTNLKNILVWLAVVVSLVLLWQLFYNIRDVNVEDKDFTVFSQDMTAKKIKSAKIAEQDLEWDDLSGKKFKTTIPAEGGYEIGKELKDNGATVKFEKSSNSSFPVYISILLAAAHPYSRFLDFPYAADAERRQ